MIIGEGIVIGEPVRRAPGGRGARYVVALLGGASGGRDDVTPLGPGYISGVRDTGCQSCFALGQDHTCLARAHRLHTGRGLSVYDDCYTKNLRETTGLWSMNKPYLPSHLKLPFLLSV